MKEMFKFQFAILLLFVLNSCSATHFPEGKPSPDPDYGFSPENPLTLKASFEKQASRKTADYLKALRTAEGEKLKLVGKAKVANPHYKKPRIVLYNWITGEQINQGNGRFLIRYEVQSETGKDSLQLYVNHFVKEEPLIPVSLFQVNDTSLGRSLVSGTE